MWKTFCFVAVAIAAAVALRALAAEPSAGKPAHAHGSAPGEKGTPGTVSLDVYVDADRLHVLTAERAAPGAKPQLRYVRSDDGGETWSAPVPVGEGLPTPDPVKRGNDAQVVAVGDRLLAVWTIGAATRMGRGPLAAARSDDGGRTWTPAPSPSDSKLVIDHAFVDLAADEAGNVHCVWLDGRHGVRPDGKVAEDAGKGLRYARSGDAGRSWSLAATLDPQCCECCWNSLLVLPGGSVHVLYRDRDPRDMSTLVSADAGRTWGKPSPVGAFQWDFTGCPHVGGALAASRDGRSMSAVVWTAKGGDDVGAFVLSSPDAGRSWSDPARLGGVQANRPDVACDPAGREVVAVWDEYLDTPDASGNAVFAARSRDGGKTWAAPERLTAPRTSATHPRVVRLPDGFRVFWTQKAAGKPTTWESRQIN